MSEIAIGNGVSESVVLTAPTYLKNGKIGDAIACLQRSLGSKTTGWDWSLRTKSA